MDCKICKDWLASNWLDWPRPEPVREHLALCPGCKAECARIAAISNTLDGMAFRTTPANLRGKVLSAVNSRLCERDSLAAHQKSATLPAKVTSSGHLAQGRVLFSMAVCMLFAVIGLGLPISLENSAEGESPWTGTNDFGSVSSDRKSGSAWPFWTNTVQEEGKKAFEVAYRCVRPAAEVSWVTMSKAIREAPGPFAFVSGS